MKRAQDDLAPALPNPKFERALVAPCAMKFKHDSFFIADNPAIMARRD
jgi:hypothetical protein